MIFLTAGHNRNDSGAVYNGRKEATETIRLRNAISAKLRETNHVYNDSDDWDLSKTIAEISKVATQNDVVCDLHFNAGQASATGCEVFVPDFATQRENNLATELVNTISGVLGIKNRGVKKETESAHKRLGMMRIAGVNVLIEICFISNTGDMQKYDERFNALVNTIANILAKH